MTDPFDPFAASTASGPSGRSMYTTDSSYTEYTEDDGERTVDTLDRQFEQQLVRQESEVSDFLSGTSSEQTPSTREEREEPVASNRKRTAAYVAAGAAAAGGVGYAAYGLHDRRGGGGGRGGDAAGDAGDLDWGEADAGAVGDADTYSYNPSGPDHAQFEPSLAASKSANFDADDPDYSLGESQPSKATIDSTPTMTTAAMAKKMAGNSPAVPLALFAGLGLGGASAFGLSRSAGGPGGYDEEEAVPLGGHPDASAELNSGVDVTAGETGSSRNSLRRFFRKRRRDDDDSDDELSLDPDQPDQIVYQAMLDLAVVQTATTAAAGAGAVERRNRSVMKVGRAGKRQRLLVSAGIIGVVVAAAIIAALLAKRVPWGRTVPSVSSASGDAVAEGQDKGLKTDTSIGGADEGDGTLSFEADYFTTPSPAVAEESEQGQGGGGEFINQSPPPTSVLVSANTATEEEQQPQQEGNDVPLSGLESPLESDAASSSLPAASPITPLPTATPSLRGSQSPTPSAIEVGGFDAPSEAEASAGPPTMKPSAVLAAAGADATAASEPPTIGPTASSPVMPSTSRPTVTSPSSQTSSSAAPVASPPTTEDPASIPTLSQVTAAPTKAEPSRAPALTPVTDSPIAGAPITSGPTGVPNTSPISAPVTASPSRLPTFEPTPLPGNPTRAPVPPTPKPSHSPTDEPTESPSRSPVSDSPTRSPNRDPTHSPPTPQPTPQPSPPPSRRPSPEPTPLPGNPTKSPVPPTPLPSKQVSDAQQPTGAPATSPPPTGPTATASKAPSPVTSQPSTLVGLTATVSKAPSSPLVTSAPNLTLVSPPSPGPTTSQPSPVLTTSEPTKGEFGLSTGYCFDDCLRAAGFMFNVVAKKDVSISGFSAHIHTTVEEYVEIYTISGTFLPAQADAGQWEKIEGRVVEDPMGKGSGTRLPNLLAPILMRAGETRAFYITLLTSNMDYSMGYGPYNSTIAENDDVAITNGVGKEYPYDESFGPRKFDGEVHYEQYDLSQWRAGAKGGLPRPPSPAPTAYLDSSCASETDICGPDTSCPQEDSCCSQWGYCGTSEEYCGACCQGNACWSIA